MNGVAEALCGAPVVSVEPVGQGGNSRVYRVDAARGGRYAMKRYPLPDAADPRDRLAVEFEALELLNAHGFADVPRPVAADRGAGVALYGWMEGEAPEAIGAGEIDAAVDFAGRLRAVGSVDVAQGLPLASEACLSAAELVRQIGVRHERLSGLIDEPELALFLRDELASLIERMVARAEESYRAGGLPFAEAIAPRQRTLSSSDFGFHNALRSEDGRLLFVDFEYFGWDDPVKLVADFLWHPGMSLDAGLRERFHAASLRLFGDDADFEKRLTALYPLYGLRWALIVLNEFLPAIWQRRREASGAGAGEWPEVKRQQLDKARAIVARVREQNHAS